MRFGCVEIYRFRDISQWPSWPWTIGIIIAPWPREEQEVGSLVRSLAYIEFRWGHWFRYSPNRAEYWLKTRAIEAHQQ